MSIANNAVVCVGVALLLCWTVARLLLERKSALSKSHGARALLLMLRHGFWIALLVIVVGVVLQTQNIALRVAQRYGVAPIDANSDFVSSAAEANHLYAFLAAHTGQIVYLNTEYTTDLTGEVEGEDCFFTLHPLGLDSAPGHHFIQSPDDYALCILDDKDTEDAYFAGYINAGFMRLEGYFSVLGDVGSAGPNVKSISLAAVSRVSGHDRLQKDQER